MSYKIDWIKEKSYEDKCFNCAFCNNEIFDDQKSIFIISPNDNVTGDIIHFDCLSDCVDNIIRYGDEFRWKK